MMIDLDDLIKEINKQYPTQPIKQSYLRVDHFLHILDMIKYNAAKKDHDAWVKRNANNRIPIPPFPSPPKAP